MDQIPPRVLLLIDDTDQSSSLFNLMSERNCFSINRCSSVPQFLQILGDDLDGYDVAILDEELLEGQQVFDVLKVTKQRFPKLEIILFTNPLFKNTLDALQSGAFRCHSKDINIEEFCITIYQASEFSRLHSRSQEKDLVEELVKTKTILSAQNYLVWEGVFSSAYRHQVMNNLIAIRDFIYLVEEDLVDGVSNEKIQNRLQRVHLILSKTMNIDDEQQFPENNDQLVTVNTLLKERMEYMWARIESKRVEFSLSLDSADLLQVRANPGILLLAFDILIQNSLDAMEKALIKKISIETRLLGKNVEIIIGDTGHGIPEAIRPYLFRKPVDKSKGDKGLGIGLLTANFILQYYHGGIRIIETGPSGTRVMVWLPNERSDFIPQSEGY